MTDTRKKLLTYCRRIVVKLGSSVLEDPGGGVDQDLIASLAGEMASLRKKGYQFIIVSSGAILMGMRETGKKKVPVTISTKQALAAIGQSRLMHAYESAFSKFGITVGQMLLTREGLADRKRFVNALKTIGQLMKLEVIPVINENDTVAVDEIKFSDNDLLSSMVVNLASADVHIILTDIGGLYDRDPRFGEGKLVEVVDTINDEIMDMAGGPGEAGSGGMSTKVMAAKMTAHRGVPTIIADGKTDGNLTRILAGEPVGTLFMPADKRMISKKHWLAYSGNTEGTLTLDSGAVKAVVKGKKSLLPAGIREVTGEFDGGALVRCINSSGEEIARGITNFSSEQIRKIMGKHSGEIEEILGSGLGEEVVHRDDLVIK
ncbi:MAG: glutamate 5-kinase [bacterium]